MELLPASVENMLPKLSSQEHVTDPIAYVKYFDPSGSWSWFGVEGEWQPNNDYLFYGLVHGHEKELGYFSLRELQSVTGRFGLGIERDLFFRPCRLSEAGRREAW